MKEAFISFCEDMSSASTPIEIRSGTICADFKHGMLFFSDDPIPARPDQRIDRKAYLSCDIAVLRQFKKKIKAWRKAGIPADLSKHFTSFSAFNAWRHEVYFSDEDIGWQIFLVNDAGDFHVYISLNTWLPKELEELYNLVKGKKR